jgi:hypothetical protein
MNLKKINHSFLNLILKLAEEKYNDKYYEIGVDIQLSSTGLTKIIKLTPYYLLINNTDVS